MPDERIRRVHEARKLGLSHRQIAEATDLSRTVVGRILRGEIVDAELPAIIDVEPEYRKKAFRCSGCGNLVHFRPCVICRTRRAIEAKRSTNCVVAD